MNFTYPQPLPALCLALLGALCSPGCGGSEEMPPSVILVSLDTLRRDHVGLYGYERDTTPFLDELSEECLVYDTAYTTMSWTLIAHMSLLTGLNAGQHKVWDKDSALPPTIPTLAERLRERGYYTMGFYYGEESWLHPRFGFDRGFDIYEWHRNAEEAEEHMRSALAKRPKNRPFLLFLHLFDIHSSGLVKGKKGQTLYRPPAQYLTHFDPDAISVMEGADAWSLWSVDGSKATPEQHAAIVAGYDGGIRYLDAKLGGWVDGWRTQGIFDGALTIVFSDHGEGLMQRGGRYGGHGGTTQEGLLVPLLVRLPGARRTGRVTGTVSLVDVMPTVFELAGIAPDERLAGYSLLGEPRQERLVFAARPNVEAVVKWPYKIVQYGDKKAGRIYDLSQDPRELKPIRDKRKKSKFDELAAELRAAIAAEKAGWSFTDEVNPRAGEIGEKGRQQLSEMGYAGELEDEEEEH